MSRPTLSQIARAMAALVGPPLDPEKVDEPHPDVTEVVSHLIALARRYFRGEVHRIDRLPDGAALLVANHNAGITSIEPFLLGLAWYRRTQGSDLIRFLGHDIMGKLPVVGRLLIQVGMIRASHAAAGKALDGGHKVVVLPGGNYEAFRPFSQRHRVDFGGHVGYVRLALRHNVPVVPVLMLGGHETLFVVSRGARLARLTGAKRYLRSDSFPLFFGLPWGVALGPLFHLPLPAKLEVEVGDPIDLSEHLHGDDPDDRATLARLSDLVQGELQRMMDRRAENRRWPILG